MKNPEQARLFALQQLNILDTSPSESFDRITRMASQLFGLPISAVSLTDADRQWFKSRVGVDHCEIPREKAPCADVSTSSQVVIINDMLASSCYRESHLANSGIRFYAGAPLTTREGYTLGAMCVLGTEPREVTEQEKVTLVDLAAMVMSQIELQHAFGRVDSLTGLANRGQFDEGLQDLTLDAPGEQRVALFTEVVEASELSILHRTMGPAFLDELARVSAQCLQEAIGSESKLYHLGSGQFVHLVSADSDERLIEHALRLREDLMALESAREVPVLVRPVVGIATFRLGEMTVSDILRSAHAASLDARHMGEGAGLFSTELDDSFQRRIMLLSDVSRALESDDEFYLVFQPRVSVKTGVCQGAEALLRWRHPVLGEVSPAEFIPLIENTPMARSLTAWVVHRAIRQAALWHRQGRKLRISINVSATNLEEADFAQRVLAELREANLPTDAIELEVTESALIGKGQAAVSQLDILTEAGILIAIDDFGTGYSSLSYLHELPANIVKIDRGFITHLGEDARTRTLVASMIGMAHDLGYSVVAEGVESEAALAYLGQLGCNEVQGYLFAKPLLPDTFETWLGSKGAARVG
ncbi:sensor domain-containing phosphodiesterase [Halomonas daqiaonensis]|uniref:EAL domain, c-di-GMP-specific phosphodiesterase class I (Or its enzymatically inactive variant) n=1 Tax=Halomonas daqiaonensis TaxID=650850 RepID=A0A1H7MNW1_9GAMM|nr:sensor domain-containing phosphodiesterase [Halomonas daqiaonensis]SEL12893.1 EAL domain, c-di-GMP-specific phosphodiesterase class I (or its enzymatically inactive variant) [Halomonas daqiaonensis]